MHLSLSLIVGLLTGSSPEVINVARAVEVRETSLWQSGPWTVFVDADSGILEGYDAETGELFSTGLPVAQNDNAFPLAEPFLVVVDRYALFLADEAQFGQDLNGDGGTDDAVLHLLDLAAKSVHSTGYATPTNSTSLWNRVWSGANPGEGDLLAFTALEFEVGDLNGDGDALDQVGHLLDASSGEIRNLAIDHGFGAPIIDGDDIYLSAREQFDGNQDLNGDGDTDDWVLFRHHAPAGTTTNLGRAALPNDGGLFLVSEPWEGIDLNGDGLVQDFVWHGVDPATGQLVGLGLVPLGTGFGGAASAIEEDEGIHFVQVQEAGIGLGLDVNGDGDLQDYTGLWWDAEAHRLGRSGLDMIYSVALEREGDNITLAAVVPETPQSGDLNGDGDLLDRVLQFLDRDGELRTAPWAGGTSDPPAVSDSRIAVLSVSEFAQGADLNGDGQLFGNVLVAYDADHDVSRVLRWSGTRFVAAGLAWVVRSELGEQRDLNGDGDSLDFLLFSLEVGTGKATDYGLAVSNSGSLFEHDFSDVAVPVLVPEDDVDLNGDGDTQDSVLHVVIPR